jgi:hypothetical protein
VSRCRVAAAAATRAPTLARARSFPLSLLASRPPSNNKPSPCQQHQHHQPQTRKNPNEPCSLAALRALGVLSWRMDAPDSWEEDPKLAAIRKVRGYSYTVRV